MKDFIRKNNPYLFLLLIIVIGYWQVSFLQDAFKWDLIDVVFPFRYYFSECIQSGFFPFWNPYLQTGTPFFADLQAPVFYPELIITSLLGGYSIYTMHFWFMAYLILAGFGMYKLSYYFNNNQNASFLAAIAYSFSGFIVGHGQHFFLLVGAAWIPWVIVNYLKLLENRTFRQVLKTSVLVFLMISGAYQALSFTLMYLLFIILIYFVIKEVKAKRITALIQIVKANIYLLLAVLVFSLPLIISTLEVVSEVNRLGSGISLAQTQGSGIHLNTLISFVLPYSTLHNEAFFGGTDISMRNHYFGLIPLVFFTLALLKRRSVLEYIMFVFGILIFASAFQFFPVREILFKYVPLMNLFKYAAYLRVFGILAFILLSANYFAYFQSFTEKEQVKLKYVIAILFVGIIAIMAFSQRNLKLPEFFELLGFWGNLLMQSLFQLLVLVLFFVLLFFRKKTRFFYQFILFLFVAEIVLASQLNIPETVGDAEIKPEQMKRDLELMPENFAIPFDNKIKYNTAAGDLPPPFWRNTANFTKQVTFASFSSFELDSYNKLDDDFPNLKEAVLNNKLYYFSDSIFPVSNFSDKNIIPEFASKHLYLSNKDYQKLKSKKAAVSLSDQARIVEFSPNKMVFATQSSNNQFFTLVQTNYKGWKAFIDDEETEIYTSNFNYRTIFLPSGNHTVKFEYRNRKILVFYIITNILFLLSVLWLTGSWLQRKYPSKKYGFIAPAFLLMLVVLLVLKIVTSKPAQKSTFEVLAEKWQDKNGVYKNKQNVLVSIGENDEYYNLQKMNSGQITIKEGTLVVKAKLLPDTFVEALIVSDIPGRESSVWNGMSLAKQIENTSGWNNIIYQRNFYDLKEGEQIQLYFWNNKKHEFKLDSVSVEIYPFK